MEISVKLMRQLDQVDPELRQILYAILEEIGRQSQERVTKDEFRDLRQAVQELTQAQSRTESRMEELAQAQSRTESRMEELAQAQARTESRMEELAQAQAKTESRMEELAQAQSRTESRVDTLALRMEELAQAQAKTETEMRKLARGQRDLQKQMGGLSDAVGYGIEDRLMPYIPEYARLEFGIELDLPERRNVVYPDGKYDEVNILARGSINGEDAYFIAECKSRPGKKDADRFAAMLNRLSRVLAGRFFPVLIGYSFSPELEHYVAQKYPHIQLAGTHAVQMRALKKKTP